jgi:hypothetical protein
VGPRDILDAVVREKFPSPAGNRILGRRSKNMKLPLCLTKYQAMMNFHCLIKHHTMKVSALDEGELSA